MGFIPSYVELEEIQMVREARCYLAHAGRRGVLGIHHIGQSLSSWAFRWASYLAV